MTLYEKLEAFKKSRILVNTKSGEVFGIRGKLIDSKTSHGYIKCGLNIKGFKTIHVFAHQLIWYMEYNEVIERPYVIDHIDRNKSNNRIDNLRKCTHNENIYNSNKSDNMKGVYWKSESNKWIAQITINNRTTYIGSYTIEEDAIYAFKLYKENNIPKAPLPSTTL